MNRYILFFLIPLLIISVVANAQNSKDTVVAVSKDSIHQYSEIELNALRMIDSVKQAELRKKEERRFNFIINRRIDTRYFSLPINKLVDYSNFEGFRLGFGLITNNNFSKYFSVEGYFGYGLKDENWKYGGGLSLFLHKKTESKLHFSYMNDVVEKAGYSFFEKRDITSTEVYRKFLVDKMDLVEKYQVSLSFLSFPYLSSNVFINKSFITDTDNYFYGASLTDATNSFVFSEIGLQLRYAYNEKNIRSEKNIYVAYTNYPVIMANIIKGTNWFDAEYEYVKYEAKITKTFYSQPLGKTKLAVIGGLIDGKVPLTKLYNGHGSYQPFSIETENSFGTMRMGEFYSDKFLSVFFKHDFGNLFVTTDIFKPSFAIVNNFGIGELSENAYHLSVEPIQSIEKGYYECGLLINNILNQSFLGYGFGLFYRYGPYTFNKTADNFSYKLSLTIEL